MCAKAFAEPELAAALADPDVALALAQPQLAAALADDEIATALANPAILKALAQQELTKALADPEVAAAFASPELAKALATPAVQSALSAANVQAAMANAAFAKAMAEPELATALKNPAVAAALAPAGAQPDARTIRARALIIEDDTGQRRAMLAAARPAALEAVSRAGADLGLAFQIVDDILDVEGSLAELGKSAGSDERKKKATYPACHGLDASKQKARMLIDETKRRLSPLGPPAAPLLALADFVIERRS